MFSPDKWSIIISSRRTRLLIQIYSIVQSYIWRGLNGRGIGQTGKIKEEE